MDITRLICNCDGIYTNLLINKYSYKYDFNLQLNQNNEICFDINWDAHSFHKCGKVKKHFKVK